MPQERTTLGPLVEKWQYPNRCRNVFMSCTTCSKAWQAQKCGDEDAEIEGVVDDIGCWPPTSMELPSTYPTSELQRTRMQTSTTVGVSLPLKGWGIYYPANQCPDGYVEACWGQGSMTGDFNFQFSVYDNERVKECCPSGYTCAGAGGQQTCTSVTSKGEVQIAMCDGTKTIFSDITLPTQFSGDVSLKALTLYAPMIQAVTWEEDLPSSTSTSTGTSTSSWLLGATITRHYNSGPGSGSGLSTGAQAAIAFVSVVFGLGIVAVAALLLRGRGRPKVSDEATRNKPQVAHGKPEVTYDQPQLDSREVNPMSGYGAPQQHTHGTGELDGTSARQELNGTSARHELP